MKATDTKRPKTQLLRDLVVLQKENSRLRDICDKLKESERIQREREEKLKLVLASMDDLVFSLDENGVFTGFFQPTDRPELYTRPDDFIGRSFKEVLPAETAQRIAEAFRRVKSTRASQHMDYSLDIGGSPRWYNARLSIIKRHNGGFAGVTAVVRDITDRKLAEEMLEKAASVDLLTGLSNRRDITQKLLNEISRFRRNSRHFSLIMSDIDLFKQINDRRGHECGDYVLQKVAELQRVSLRQQDCVGRWGGEEFIILLPETGLEGGKTVAEKVRRKIADADFSFKGISFKVTMSFGVSVYDREMPMEDLINAADERLYKAKETGRNRVIAESPP